MTIRTIGMALAMSVSFIIPAAACSLSDIEITNWSYRASDVDIQYVGYIVNHCAEPIGVEMQATFLDNAGHVVDVDRMYPADTRNIASGEGLAFKGGIITMGEKSISNVQLKVLDVFPAEVKFVHPQRQHPSPCASAAD